MSMSRFRAQAPIVVLVVVGFAIFYAGRQPAVVGKWELQGKDAARSMRLIQVEYPWPRPTRFTQRIEFFKDHGGLIMRDADAPGFPVHTGFTWKEIGDGQTRIETTRETLVVTLTAGRSTLTIIGTGLAGTYRRIP
jgi:hypothetical protein